MDDDQQFCLRWNNHQSTLVAVFDTLLENGTLVDCTLAAEGKCLNAHKVVLSACSPYFESLLSRHFDKHPILILKDVKFQELKAMMDYMYRGEVNISQDQLGALLKAAESLQIKGLSDNKRGETERKPAPAPPPSKSPQPAAALPKVQGLTIEQRSREDSREGSQSPGPRKKKRMRRKSEDMDNHDASNSSESHSLPAQNIPSSLPAVSKLNADVPEPVETKSDILTRHKQDEIPQVPIIKEKLETHTELMLEPKSEYVEEMNEDSIEDLTLDDDDLSNMEQMDDGAGPSHGNMGEGSSQGFGWHMGNQSQDEVFLAAQEAVGAHRDSQDMDILTGHYSDELLESINGLAIGHKMSHSQENISKKDESTDLDGEPARKQGRFNDEEILYVIDTPSESNQPETHSLSLASTKTILGDAVYPKDGEIKICSNLGDIKRVLQDSVIGRAIVLKQANKKKIEIKDRDAICSIIITHFLNKGIKLNNAGLSAVADRIVDIFPSENKATFYVAPIPKKQSRYNRPEVARGKLVDKQRNKLTAIRKQLKSANNSETNEQSMEEQSEESEDATNAKIWLKQNTKLDQYELIIENWKKAYPIRKLEGKTIQEFFIDWPILSTQIAPELIRLDFEERFPGNNIEITETFDTFFQIVLEQRRCNLTVADNTLLELIDTEITNDSKNAIRLYLLASLVPPRGRTKLGRQHWKPSLPESRDGLFVHVNIAGDIERAKKNRTDFMYRKNLTVQPYVLIVGPSLSNVSCSYVIINEHMYKTPSVLSALDICFKAYKVLDAKYSYECQHLWLLIQWHIYNLKCKFDPKVPFIEDIRF